MNNKKLKREESFFGLHFDFHANENSEQIGANTTEEMIEEIIDIVDPDFIQCDCKGHPGFSSYPTKVGNQAPGIVTDALKIWRKVTEKRNVALFVHYSGVDDWRAVELHPEWACVNPDGTPHHKATSLFGDYADKLLIPQLKELAGEYGIDGVWLDGECVAMHRDYSEKAIKKFKEKTGITNVPRNENDEHYEEFSQFCRDEFITYLEHYTSEVKKEYPHFEIASNYAFSASHQPEKPIDCVDFLSGDIFPLETMNLVRLDTRYFASQGKTWELMGWAMGKNINVTSCSFKSSAMLKQEAAMVLSQGGGFQLYYTQKKDGSVERERYENAREIAQFCRARREFCHKQKIKPDVALFLSKRSLRKEQPDYLHWFGEGRQDSIKNINEILCKNRYNVNVVSDHHLDEDINRYKVIVVPQWKYIDNKDQLVEYAKNGGNLVVLGAFATRHFENELGVRFKNAEPEKRPLYIKQNKLYIGLGTELNISEIELKGAKLLKNASSNMYDSGEQIPVATVNDIGKGKIVGVYFDFALEYKKAKNVGILDFVNEVISSVYEPDVKVEGSRFIDVSVGEKDGKTIINLVNTYGSLECSDMMMFDEIPEIHNIKIEVKTNKKPKSITKQPENKPIDFEFTGDKVKLTLDKLEIYDMVVIEY